MMELFHETFFPANPAKLTETDFSEFIWDLMERPEPDQAPRKASCSPPCGRNIAISNVLRINPM
jgi:hypothetical protein